MKGYVFTHGIGFEADIAPVHEEGVYLNYDKAFKHLCELNLSFLVEHSSDPDIKFYEEGYTSDFHYPKQNKILRQAEKAKDWFTFYTEFEKHRLTTIEDICKLILTYEEPPYTLYGMKEIEIYE